MRIWELEYPPLHQDICDCILKAFPASKIEEFSELFFPYGAFWGQSEYDVLPLLAYMAEGLIKSEILPAYVPTSKPSRIRVPERNYLEDHSHLRLKRKAVLWLKEKGVAGFQFHGSYEAGRFDVASDDRNWIIECGGARPSKVYQFLSKRPKSHFVVFNEKAIGLFSAGANDVIEDYLRSYDERVWGPVLELGRKRMESQSHSPATTDKGPSDKSPMRGIEHPGKPANKRQKKRPGN